MTSACHLCFELPTSSLAFRFSRLATRIWPRGDTVRACFWRECEGGTPAASDPQSRDTRQLGGVIALTPADSWSIQLPWDSS